MAYKNPVHELITALYTLISGVSVEVYKETVDPTETGNYVLLRAEGQSMIKNHSAFIGKVVLVSEVVTKFGEVVDRSVLDGICDEIDQLIFPSPNTFGITGTTNHQVTDITISTSNYITEYDGINTFYSKQTRYEFTINQK